MTPHDQRTKSIFLSLLLCLAASTLWTSGSAFAQCARPGFRLSDGYFNATNGGYVTTTADFNNDGKADLAMVNSTGFPFSGDRVTVLFGDGTGKLAAPASYAIAVGSGYRAIAADLNNDGKPDLVTLGLGIDASTAVSVLLNNGSGAFGGAVTTTVGNNSDQQIGDINADGRADLVSLLRSPMKLQIRFGDGTGHFTSPTEPSIFGSTFQLGDFNGDNKTDVAIKIADPFYRVQVYLNNGSGTLLPGSSTPLGPFDMSLQGVRDFDGNGTLDIIGEGSPHTELSILYNNGAGAFTRTNYTVAGGDSFLVGDFDGNGKPDVLTGYNQFYFGFLGSPSVNSLLLNNGGGGFTRNDYYTLPGGRENTIADFNNDGKDDVIQINRPRTTGQPGVQVWLRTCNYTLNTKRVDYNGDGMTEFAVWRPLSGEWIIRPYPFGTLTQQWGSFGDVPVPGDYDGDNKSDLAVFRAPTGGWYILQSSDNMPLYVQWGANGDKPVPGDYDGDGKTDVAVFRPSDGGWYILKSSDNSLSVSVFGTNGDKPVQADFDNDDKTDVAVFRPSSATWHILKSGDSSVSTITFGASGDKPVPGDYDGDGKADIAVFRSGAGWYILQSGNNNAFQGVDWGTAATPAPGTFYFMNMGVDSWDASTGNFYVFPTPVAIHLGVSGDIPVTAPYVIE